MDNFPKQSFLDSLIANIDSVSEEERILLEKKAKEMPIAAFQEKIENEIRGKDRIIISADTGSGKSTQIGFYAENVLEKEGAIAITQPRAIAAKELAKYTAKRKGKGVGDEIGYQVRFDSKVSDNTKINFMTDGMLLQILKSDPALSKFSAVMVDEAHEESINIYFLLWLLKYRVPEERKKLGLSPLKEIVSSATLEKSKFEDYLGTSSLEVPGKIHPIDISYFDEAKIREYTEFDRRTREYFFNYMRAAADYAEEFLRTDKHTILVFMPGWEEIQKTIEYLEAKNILDADILPLHSDIKSEEELEKIFSVSKRRKIVVATNIAETSVTLPEPVDVVDSGLIKEMEYDPETGIESLVLKKHSKSGIKQRGGRAGRLEKGRCARLFTEDDFKARDEPHLPEIKRMNLSHIILTMKKMGINDASSLFEFIDPPSEDAVLYALEELKNLGALDEKENLTELGDKMAEFPLAPQFSKMLIEANKNHCVNEIASIIAFISESRSVFFMPRDADLAKKKEIEAVHKQFIDPTSDFITYLNIWNAWRKENFSASWAHNNFLKISELRKIKDARYQFLDILMKNVMKAGSGTEEDVRKTVFLSFSHNLVREDPKGARGSYRRLRDGKTNIYIHPSSAIFSNAPRFFIAAQFMKTKKQYAINCEELNIDKIKLVFEKAPQIFTLKKKPYSETKYDILSDSFKESFDVYFKDDSNPLFETEKEEENPVSDNFKKNLAFSGIIEFLLKDNERRYYEGDTHDEDYKDTEFVINNIKNGKNLKDIENAYYMGIFHDDTLEKLKKYL